MKMDCEVISDLLPLYADNACSEKSRQIVEEHLQECPACGRLLSSIRETELEGDLFRERDAVIRRASQRFRRRSAAVGSAVSGAFMIPVLVLLILNFVSGPKLDWVSVVIASLCVLAALVLVPILMPEDKLFWTFCAFCASLVLLLGVVCLYTKGDWFGIASSAVLFGLSVVFLPFLIRARPLKKLIGDSNRLLIVLCVDFGLFINMLNMIKSQGRISLNNLLFTVVVIVCIAVVVCEIVKRTARR